MNIDQLIEHCYPTLNEQDLYIWQYIRHHRRQCSTMAILDLANACNVSKTSIIRFAQKLGLSGYSELKVRVKISASEKNELDATSMYTAMQEQKDFIERIEQMDFKNIMDLIYAADRVFVYATGEVQAFVAQELRRLFLFAKKIMHVIESDSELDPILRAVSAKDVFIMISFGGNNVSMITLAKLLRVKGTRIVCITQNGKSAIHALSDESISFHSTAFQTGFSTAPYSISTQYYFLCNMLVIRYFEYVDMMKKESIELNV